MRRRRLKPYFPKHQTKITVAQGRVSLELWQKVRKEIAILGVNWNEFMTAQLQRFLDECEEDRQSETKAQLQRFHQQEAVK